MFFCWQVHFSDGVCGELKFCWQRVIAEVTWFLYDFLFKWFPKVEKSHECQEILECRMRDGMIPQGRLVSDVCGYTPDAETQSLATALTGGFPCQVHDLDNLLYSQK